MTTTEWAEQYRRISARASAIPGRYRAKITPCIPYMHQAIDDPRVWKVVCMKSAQVAWTDGVVNNVIGRKIDIDPSPMIVMFAKEGAGKEYVQEKFEPMVEATPRLQDKIDLSKSRKADNRQLFKNFPGGFLKLVGSNSITNVKSTPAPWVFVEEPDDCSRNVGDQGDAIKLLEERTKTYARRKVVFGGTPSVKGHSTIEADFLGSDQRHFYVPCHDCGESHVLSWDNVKWDDDPASKHQIYGTARPETACYACPACGSIWTDADKNRNLQRMEVRAHAEFRGIAGFYVNELYSTFAGSRFARLVERFLEAKHQEENGDPADMIVFTNSCLGLPYEVTDDKPEADELAARAIEYSERSVPTGGLVLTAGVDVQRDRLAIVVRAWGRGEESWLVYWGEIYAARDTADPDDPVWDDLDGLLFNGFRHENGRVLHLGAGSIDSSDGGTSDAVYHFVRARQHRNIMAIKGASQNAMDREIFSVPRTNIDADKQKTTKAAKYGLRPYIVGTHKAKDLILDARIRLTGSGPGRMHAYESVRGDYYDQLTSEVKIPDRKNPRKRVWDKKSGVRNEALDCEVYALHAARSLKLHLLKPAAWDAIEARIMQADMFNEQVDTAPSPRRPQRPPAPAAGQASRVISRGVEL